MFLYPKLQAVKILEKLHIGASSNSDKFVDERIQKDSLEDNSLRKEAANGTCAVGYSVQSVPHISSPDAGGNAVDAMIGTSDVAERKHMNMHVNPLCNNESPDGHSDSEKNPGSAGSSGSGTGGSSSKGENDLHLLVDSTIQWEDLQLKEEIGQGKV